MSGFKSQQVSASIACVGCLPHVCLHTPSHISLDFMHKLQPIWLVALPPCSARINALCPVHRSVSDDISVGLVESLLCCMTYSVVVDWCMT
jgi:hypothetical protein